MSATGHPACFGPRVANLSRRPRGRGWEARMRVSFLSSLLLKCIAWEGDTEDVHSLVSIKDISCERTNSCYVRIGINISEKGTILRC